MAIGWIGRQGILNGESASIVQMPPQNFKACSKFQNTFGVDMIIDTAGAGFVSGSGGVNCRMVAYTDNAGVPDALIAATNNQFGVSGSQLFTFPTPWTWAAGAFVWIGLWADQQLNEVNPDGITNVYYNSETFNTVANPSNPYGTPLTANFEYCVWAEGYDALNRLGRISIKEGRRATYTVGEYYANDPHFDKFSLGGVESPTGAAASVTVTNLWVYTTSAVGSLNAQACIVADDSGNPLNPNGGTLLGTTSQIAAFAANTWNLFTFSPAIVLPTPANYWLGIVSDTGGVTTNVNISRGFLASEGGAQAGSHYPFTNPISGASLFQQAPSGISIYVDYVVPSVGSAREVRGTF